MPRFLSKGNIINLKESNKVRLIKWVNAVRNSICHLKNLFRLLSNLPENYCVCCTYGAGGRFSLWIGFTSRIAPVSTISFQKNTNYSRYRKWDSDTDRYYIVTFGFNSEKFWQGNKRSKAETEVIDRYCSVFLYVAGCLRIQSALSKLVIYSIMPLQKTCKWDGNVHTLVRERTTKTTHE